MKVIRKPSREGRRAEQALREAVDAVVEEHRRLGLPLAVMRNGKAVFVPAYQLKRSRRTKNGRR